MTRITYLGRLVLVAGFATLGGCIAAPGANAPPPAAGHESATAARERQGERELGVFWGGAGVGEGTTDSGGVGAGISAPAASGVGGTGPGGTSGASSAGGGGGY